MRIGFQFFLVQGNHFPKVRRVQKAVDILQRGEAHGCLPLIDPADGGKVDLGPLQAPMQGTAPTPARIP